MAAEVLTTGDQAKELLQLIATPSALVTGTFLAFAGKALKENPDKRDRARMTFACLAALAAVAVAGALVALMAPLAWTAFKESKLEAVFVVYWTIFLSVIGTAAYAGLVLWRCAVEWKKPS